MNRFAVFLVAAILGQVLLMDSVSPYILERVQVHDYLNEDLGITENISFSVSNNSRDSFQFTFPETAYNVTVNGVEVNNSPSLPLGCETCTINITYNLNDIAKLEKDGISFSRTLNYPAVPRILNYSVYLPSGYVLALDPKDPAIVPATKHISTDGAKIIVTWSDRNPEMPRGYVLKYRDSEQFIGLDMIWKEMTEFAVWVIAAVVLIIGISIGMMLCKATSRKRRQPFVPSSLLNPDEKEIISLISRHGKQMNQKEVGKKLNWSKSKVSAIMTNLEYKKIVEREKIGRNYRVSLIKKID
jgi:uncharacterized membrane protein